jgi:hypothetical protein
VQELRCVSFLQWFPAEHDPRAIERFYTPLQEDFFRAFLRVGTQFSGHRIDSVESICRVEGEEVHPYLSYLPGLSYLIGQTGSFVDT